MTSSLLDQLFFYSSKIIWNIISPDSLFLVLLLLSLLLLLLKRRRSGLMLLTLISFSLLFLSIFSVGGWMLYPLETRFQHNPQLPPEVDGIIVLGGSVNPARSHEWDQLETNRYHERLSNFIQLAERYPEARLLFTGGNSGLSPDLPTEAEMVKGYFLSAGIASDRLMLEDKARNTAENASLSKPLAKPQPGDTWLLITTAYHMPRSVGVFCQQQWPVIPYPVDHQVIPSKRFNPGFSLLDNANSLVMGTHEWIGLLAYYLSGKTGSLFPELCR